MARNAKNTRMCSGCRLCTDKVNLIALNLFNDNFTFNTKGEDMDGRAAYFCPKKKCYDMIIKKKHFSRFFKREIPKEIYSEISEYLASHGQE